MPQDANKILTKMLDRLFAALANGPSLNCKPHSSRQRVDLIQFAAFADRRPDQLLQDLLGESRAAKVSARVPVPPKRQNTNGKQPEAIGAPQQAAEQAWNQQQSLIGKLRTIAEDAKTYENDTGVHVLQLGFPLLSLPPGSFGVERNFTRRILAPIAFISVALTVRGGAPPSVVLECRNEGRDLVVPNAALLAWLEQQTGQEAMELPDDESGEHPWEEIGAIVRRVASLAELAVPPGFAADGASSLPALQPAPHSEADDAKPAIVPAAILGLFPLSNQGLLRDMQALAGGETVSGPLESFLRADVSLLNSTLPAPVEPEPVKRQPRVFAEERLVADADPCQARAVKLARTCRGLVVHGPPGTGKSQTITNIIADHLSRGQRVLLVCDKRTALDVVIHRLEGLGLGQLCAVVHDPQRDQRELYKAIHEQLDGLAEARTNAHADEQVAKLDVDLQKLHQQLSEYHSSLMESADGKTPSFHQLVGQWLELVSTMSDFDDSRIQGVTLDELEAHSHAIGEVLDRASGVGFAGNPWAQSAGITLKELLATPMERLRQRLAACVEVGEKCDATLDPAIPPFVCNVDIHVQGQKRAELGRRLSDLIRANGGAIREGEAPAEPRLAGRLALPSAQFRRVDPAILSKWAKADPKDINAARQKLADVGPLIELLKAGPLDGELRLSLGGQLPGIPQVGRQIATLDEYLAIADKWYRFLRFGTKSAARRTAGQYGLALTIENAQRLRKFLLGLRARLILRSIHQELMNEPAAASQATDDVLEASLSSHAAVLEALLSVDREPSLASLRPLVAQALADPASSSQLIDGLGKSPARASAIAAVESSLKQAHLFSDAWLASTSAKIREGQQAVEPPEELSRRQQTLEGVLRVKEGLASLPDSLRAITAEFVQRGIESTPGLVVLKRAALSLEITRRLAAQPTLQSADTQNLRSSFDRYRTLERQKKTFVRDAILHRWIGLQQQRVLASTGSRLNSQGADLRRRLTTRGQRAMRLRQVVAAGQNIERGDPLFDLRPVWMASPQTVAQVFGRKPLFDVVIFDEASQCRLEEALPVLTRATRLVVAGDPKQLPPTRFFESALTVSEDEDPQTEQDLFEVHQSEIEDLLGAALNLEIQECYLDVHYRSRNADLIAFSNEHFYNSRLQPIPAHPSHRARFAPVTLYECGGAYEKRCNVAEAEQVCRIVRDLFKRADPPSIGIACFNLQQRDLIVEKLDELAAEDEPFGRKLAAARNRRTAGSFDGLFVKNLESVQGDERDHIIISTTYGPDAKGKFYRRFGPLGRAGGGRRLNVLVTRARDEVHLVTSIPQNVYRALPPIPQGQKPGGAWLLFAYLQYARHLAQQYEPIHRTPSPPAPNRGAVVNVRPTRWPSRFARSLGHELAERHDVASDVHWGNDGFCIDLALRHPRRPDDIAIGVLCDLARFAQAHDAVEWEIFRTAMLEAQGWKLHRLWTPHFYRDPQGSTRSILKELEDALAEERENDASRATDSAAEEFESDSEARATPDSSSRRHDRREDIG